MVVEDEAEGCFDGRLTVEFACIGEAKAKSGVGYNFRGDKCIVWETKVEGEGVLGALDQATTTIRPIEPRAGAQG
uniref:Uncharacterized protein n=1 Tax=Cannabis sativa TaxID=3483 RepID=A0A803QRT8_CANSA